MTTTIVTIENIGFEFAVCNRRRWNLISPSVLSFFNIPESESETEVCTFRKSIPNTNQRDFIFKNVGSGLTICSDGRLRRCRMVKCTITIDNHIRTMIFYVDKSMNISLYTGIVNMWAITHLPL